MRSRRDRIARILVGRARSDQQLTVAFWTAGPAGARKDAAVNDAGKRVCVVGAGLSGLAAIRGLTRAGHEVKCFEEGSAVGGMWRYGNDNGRSAAYASLTANTSYRRMQFPSLPESDSMAEFPHHSELLAYLERYARSNDLLPHVTCESSVERARPEDS